MMTLDQFTVPFILPFSFTCVLQHTTTDKTDSQALSLQVLISSHLAIKRKRQPIGMLGRSSGNHDWLLANASACVSCGFLYATHATQAIAFEWKPGFIRRERNVLETPKLIGRLPAPRGITRTSFKDKGQRSKSPGRLMLRPKVYHIFRTEEPTNFKVGTQMVYEDSYHRQAPRPPRSKVMVACSRDANIK